MSGVNRPFSTQRRTVAVLTPKRAATSLVVIYTDFLFMHVASHVVQVVSNTKVRTVRRGPSSASCVVSAIWPLVNESQDWANVGYCALCTTCAIVFHMSTQIHGKFVPRTNTFGARLALIRWQMGWNMKEAALACGFSQQSWRGWELQGHDPRGFADVAERIAERTGVDEYWILTGKEPAAPTDPDGGVPNPKSKAVSNHGPLD